MSDMSRLALGPILRRGPTEEQAHQAADAIEALVAELAGVKQTRDKILLRERALRSAYDTLRMASVAFADGSITEESFRDIIGLLNETTP